MRHYTTPEMLSYFSEQLAENESQGVVNKVENVELIKGEVREAWDEGRLHYATALMHWRARDYTVQERRQSGTGELIVSGDAQHADRGARDVDLCAQPGRPLAALGRFSKSEPPQRLRGSDIGMEPRLKTGLSFRRRCG